MAMNRQQKRMLQKQGELGADGAPAARKRPAPQAPRPAAKEERTGPVQFLREVRGELRKVAWPSRAETINYSIIVLITVVLLTTLIALLDWGFGSAILRIYNAE